MEQSVCVCVYFPNGTPFRPGVVMGCAGLVVLLATVAVWRKMENKAPIRLTGKTIFTVVLSIVGALLLGIGMCFTMVWGNMVLGIIIGIVGIVASLSLIPIIKGLR